jgi:hypothetical protein
MIRKCKIIIPIYKSSLTSNELLSLNLAYNVLGKHPIDFLVPRSLETDFLHSKYPKCTFTYFDDEHFQSIDSYNRLLLSNYFYEQFLDYEYILIYQLDCLVLADKLFYWCDKGHDYVGAPWIEIPPKTKKRLFEFRRVLINKVGNGGFSLRKTRTMYRYSFILKLLPSFLLRNEDIYFGVIIPFFNPFYKIASFKDSLSFSFELNPKKSLELNKGKLPFGVHAWEKYNKDFWMKVLDELGLLTLVN